VFLQIPKQNRTFQLLFAAVTTKLPRAIEQPDSALRHAGLAMSGQRSPPSPRGNPPALADLGGLTLLMMLSKFTQNNEHGGQFGV
jgi:hypothetical protein